MFYVVVLPTVILHIVIMECHGEFMENSPYTPCPLLMFFLSLAAELRNKDANVACVDIPKLNR